MYWLMKAGLVEGWIEQHGICAGSSFEGGLQHCQIKSLLQWKSEFGRCTPSKRHESRPPFDIVPSTAVSIHKYLHTLTTPSGTHHP